MKKRSKSFSERVVATIVAVIAMALFVWLGRAVSHGADPPCLVTLESAWVNRSTLLAWYLTWFGFAEILAPACVALLIVAWRYPLWRARALVSVALLLVCWRGADFAQHIFARPRRLDWVVKHETSFSYPSSHAAIVAGFYLLWSVFIARSTLRGRGWAAAALLALSVGILWSRLALGAHYITDIAGGVLLGIALAALGIAILPINVLGRTAGRS